MNLKINMTMNLNVSKLISFSMFGIVCFSGISCAEKQQERPNILLIMADDHANRAISAYDGSINSTPNIDKLAEKGAIFLNSYCGNSICAPSRATILTGKHNHKHDITGNGRAWNSDQTLFPRILKIGRVHV